MRKLTKQGMMKKMDKLIFEIVKVRDGSCVTCPLWKEIKPEWKGTQVLQPGHFITRGAKTVRWSLRNVYLQCSACNCIHEYHPEIMAKYVRKFLGEKKYEQLLFDGNQNMPSIKMFQLEEIYNNLLKVYESLK